jgi:cytochrome c-type biogenesis protein CcmI
MGLVTGLLGLPFAPLKGTVWVAEQIAQEADRRLSDPGLIRRQLEEVAADREAGTISVEQAAAEERELVRRLLRGRTQARRGG